MRPRLTAIHLDIIDFRENCACKNTWPPNIIIKNDDSQPVETWNHSRTLEYRRQLVLFLSLEYYVRCFREALTILSANFPALNTDLLDPLSLLSSQSTCFIVDLNTWIELITSIASLLVNEFLFVIRAYTNRNPQHHSDGANSTKATYPVASRTRKIRKGIVQSTWVQGNKNRAPWRLCYFKLRTTNGNVNNDNLQPYRPPTGSHKPAVNTAGVLVTPLWL